MNHEEPIIGTDALEVIIRWLERLIQYPETTFPENYRAAQDALNALRYLKIPPERIEIKVQKPPYKPLLWDAARETAGKDTPQ